MFKSIAVTDSATAILFLNLHSISEENCGMQLCEGGCSIVFEYPLLLSPDTIC